MKICNLTPHKVVVEEDKTTFEPCGYTARVYSTTKTLGVETFETGNGEKPYTTIRLCNIIYGDVELYKPYGDIQTRVTIDDLPEADYYIVSSIVAERWEAMRGRMLVPRDLIRDDEGNIVGCKQFRLV